MTYTIVVTNTSATYTLTDVVVSDPDVSGCSPVLGTPITLAPSASQTYVCPNVVINGTTTNTATVTGHFIINNQASASAPQDPGGPVTDNAISDVVVTATDSVTVVAENRLIFLFYSPRLGLLFKVDRTSFGNLSGPCVLQGEIAAFFDGDA